MEMSWDRDALRHRLVPGLDLHRVAGGALVADERTQTIRRPLGCVAEVTMVGRRWRRKCGLWAKSLLDDRNINNEHFPFYPSDLKPTPQIPAAGAGAAAVLRRGG